ILVLSDNYPSQRYPTRGVFVYNLIREFAKFYRVVVVSPVPLGRKSSSKLKKLEGDPSYSVNYPRYLSFSKANYYIPYLYCIKAHFVKRAVEKEILKIPEIHFIYTHFLGSAIP